MTHSPLFAPATVAPAPPADSRPFWSVMVPTYNRQDFLGQALQGILEQDQGPDRMQICVVDNATTTFDVQAFSRQLAGDRIEYIRHPQNIGGIRNINSCFNHSRGSWVHVLHDDDLVLPGFYRAYEKQIDQHPDAALVIGPTLGINQAGFTTHLLMPEACEAGVVKDFLLNQATGHYAPTPSCVFKRSVLEQIGGYAEALAFTPDWEMAFRAGMSGPVVTVPLAYTAFRWHVGNDSGKLIRSTRHLAESKATVDELCSRLPLDLQARLPVNRYAYIASSAANYAAKLTAYADQPARIENLRWAFKVDPTRARLNALMRAKAKYLLKSLGKKIQKSEA